MELSIWVILHSIHMHSEKKGVCDGEGLEWAGYLQFIWPVSSSLYFFYCVSTSHHCTYISLHLKHHDFLQRLRKNGYERTILASVEGISSRMSF